MILLLVALVIGILLFVWTVSNPSDIYRQFNVSPIWFRIISTDLGGKDTPPIRGDGLIGKPDVIFKFRFFPYYIVCDYKSGSLLGRVKPADYYQVILYMGIFTKSNPGFVTGRLSYKSSVAKFGFDKRLYRRLLSLLPEAELLLNGRAFTGAKPLSSRYRVKFPNAA